MSATKEDIIALPNPHLRKRSKRVGVVTDEILKLIEDMKSATLDWEASREHEVGVALAAVQIDVLYRVVAVSYTHLDVYKRQSHHNRHGWRHHAGTEPTAASCHRHYCQ